MLYNSTVRPAEVHSIVSALLSECSDVKYARYETDRVIEHIYGMPVSSFWALQDVAFAEEQMSSLNQIVSARKLGKPLAYILGYAYFGGIRIHVNPSVLIPRQETEGLLLIGKELLKEYDGDEIRILDFGTGSGCIAICLSLEFPFSIVWASDVSPRAIATADENVKHFRLGMRVITLHYNGLEGIIGPINLDLLISNPPYIAEDDGRLDECVRLYEPREALIASGSGLHYFRHISRWGPKLLKPDGHIAVEVGEGQADEVRQIFYAGGAADVSIRKDLAGIDRYITARYD